MDYHEMINNPETMAKLIMYIVGFNVLLSSISSFLGFIKDKTATEVDNKAFDYISKMIGWLQKVIDFVGYNPKHK